VWVKAQTLPRLLLPYINDRKVLYGTSSTPGSEVSSNAQEVSQKLIVEFSSPNIAGDFEGKHLRSTIIGAFVSSLHEQMGWDVTRFNFLGDWGKDMALLGVGWEKFGSEEAFQKDPTAHLLDVNRKIHELFLPEQSASKQAREEAKKKALEETKKKAHNVSIEKEQDEVDLVAEIESKGLFAERNDFLKKMENGDEVALAIYKRIRDINILNYTKFYARLGITFDEYSGESKVGQETMAEIEQLLKEKNIYEESEGAWIVKLDAKSGKAVVRDRSGSSTYLLRYLAAILERSRTSDFDKMVFVASDRSGHFSKMFKIFEALGMDEVRAKLQHVQFSDVSHMSEKLKHGNQPHKILDQCENAMLEVLKADKSGLLGSSEDTAKILSTSSLLTQELSTKRASDHTFDIDAMTSFKSGTGTALQYWYMRLCSILKTHTITEDVPTEEYGSLDEEEQTKLLLVLGQYPDVTHAAFKSLESAPITTYLASVVEHLSDCLDDDDDDEEDADEAGKVEDEGNKAELSDGATQAVQDSEVEDKVEEVTITSAQAALYEATRFVLENGMRLLGIAPFMVPQPNRADTPVAA
jgi:arginyl-tRNA synthetase